MPAIKSPSVFTYRFPPSPFTVNCFNHRQCCHRSITTTVNNNTDFINALGHQYRHQFSNNNQQWATVTTRILSSSRQHQISSISITNQASPYRADHHWSSPNIISLPYRIIIAGNNFSTSLPTIYGGIASAHQVPDTSVQQYQSSPRQQLTIVNTIIINTVVTTVNRTQRNNGQYVSSSSSSLFNSDTFFPHHSIMLINN